MKKIFIIAGEASGDYIGGRLMENIKSILTTTENANVEFTGIGGQYMKNAGLHTIFSINELSIIGIWEIINNIVRVKQLINKTVDAIFSYMPDVIITIDSSGFTHRVDKMVKKRIKKFLYKSKNLKNIPIVHYVAPPVWAWRSRRAKSMHKFIDKLLVLFPFEPDLFKKYNLETIFVGHPITTDDDFDIPSSYTKNLFLQKIGIIDNQLVHNSSRISVDIDRLSNLCHSKSDIINKYNHSEKVITLLPGSRRSEIKYHMPILKKYVHLLTQKYNTNIKFIIPTTEYLAPYIKTEIQDWPQKPFIVSTKADKICAYYISDLAIAASGTVSLELARTKLPHIIIYKTSWITSFIVKYLIKISNVNLINIIAKKTVIPELLQSNCTAQNILEKSIELLETDASHKQKYAFEDILHTLKATKPDIAAREILKIIK